MQKLENTNEWLPRKLTEVQTDNRNFVGPNPPPTDVLITQGEYNKNIHVELNLKQIW